MRRRSVDPGFEALLASARARDTAACAELYQQVAGQVLGYLRARGTPEPEEVLNDSLAAAFQQLDAFRGDASGFRAWVFQIARHKRIDALRRHGRHAQAVVTSTGHDLDAWGGDAEAEAIERLEDAALQRVLRTLTPDQRDVLLLRLVGGLSLAQVATALDKPVGAVKALQHRGLERLRAQPAPTV